MNSDQIAGLLLEMPQIAKSGRSVTADDQNLKDVPLDFVKGNIVVFRQPTESLFPAGFTLVYFMDSDESAQAMKDGQLPYKMVPDRSVSQAFTSSPITDVWKKAHDKGQGGILGMLQGVTNAKEIYIDKMTVRPGFKRQSMTTKMVDTLKRSYPHAVVNFSGPTKEGSKFIKSYTGSDWKSAHGERSEVRESVRSLIEKGAHASRLQAALTDVDPEPTEDQIEAGNYAKGHVHIHGLDITIENAKGSTRSGKDKSGKEWSVVMPASYGYIKGTKGKDKDHVDVFIGPDPASELVVIVNQQTPGGRFDEHKVMLGYSNEKKAVASYDKAFSGCLGPKLRQSVHTVTMAEFKKWIDRGDHKTKFNPSKLTESSSGFKIPENWDKIEKLSKNGVTVYAGANDWEATWTVVAFRFGGSIDRGTQVWGLLPFDKEEDTGEPNNKGEDRVKEWLKLADAERKTKTGHAPQFSEEDFTKAAKQLGSKLKDYGVDRVEWTAKEVVEHVMAGAAANTSLEQLEAEIIFGDIIFKQFTEKHPYADLSAFEKAALKKSVLKVVTERFHHAPGSPAHKLLAAEFSKLGGDSVAIPVVTTDRPVYPDIAEGLLAEDEDEFDAAMNAELRQMTPLMTDEVYDAAESLFLRHTMNVTTEDEADAIAVRVINHLSEKHGIVNGTDDYDHLCSYVNGLACRHFPSDEPDDEDDGDILREPA